MQETDLRENALFYYKPANHEIAEIHDLVCGTIGIFGGNGSGKTEHALVEGLIRCTGQIPESLKATYPRQKLTGPIHMRVVCESLTTVLEPIILPKLQYFAWNGLSPQGGSQGHWGWIPRHCLIQGDWKKSYNSRLRLLSVYYRNPDTDKIEGISTVQFMSYDQDSPDFASGDVNYCLHDEPPKHAIWKENRARVMRGGKGSTMVLSMTWPDNPAIPVDWIFDEIYDKGTGPDKDPDVHVINIFSTRNPHLDQAEVAKRGAQMSTLERDTRIYGLPIRFSNRIHSNFTDQPRLWCFECGGMVLPNPDDSCSKCQGTYTATICHVEPVTVIKSNPCFCLLDPHPRKPHMLAWVQVTPNEDYEVVAELLVEGGAEDVRDSVREVEEQLQFNTVFRLMDPNMGASPSGAVREFTWQMEFDKVGLHFDLAVDSDVGRARLNDFLKPDPSFMRPRFRLDPSCVTGIFQMKRYVWAEHMLADRLDVKQVPLAKNDDFPTLFKYLMNHNPTHLTTTPVVYQRDRSSKSYHVARGPHAIARSRFSSAPRL
jgi:hypothetical protein